MSGTVFLRDYKTGIGVPFCVQEAQSGNLTAPKID